MTTYIIKHYEKEIARITAKSLHAAKIRTSKTCGNSAELYKLMHGIKLCDENGKEIASYSPFFCTWHKAIEWTI